jgi:hypothetical protein
MDRKLVLPTTLTNKTYALRKESVKLDALSHVTRDKVYD